MWGFGEGPELSEWVVCLLLGLLLLGLGFSFPIRRAVFSRRVR